jgi:CBS domain-containing protein
MKRKVISVGVDMTLREAADRIQEKKVGTLPVVDEAGILIGLISIRDIIHIFLPAFVDMISDIDFVKDFGAHRTPSTGSLREAEILTVADIMVEPVSVEEHASLIRAMSVMHKHDLLDLPVVKEGKLVGIVSWVDIGGAFIADWRSSKND